MRSAILRVTVDIMRTDPARWKHSYPGIAGMHWFINFVGPVGKLMKNSKQDMLMETAFVGVDKMPIGKKFTMNVRALRVVLVELLRILIDKDTTQMI